MELMKETKKDIRLYSTGMFVMTALDIFALVFTIATRGFNIDMLAQILNKSTGFAFGLVIISIVINVLAAVLKVQLGLKGFRQLKDPTDRKHIKTAMGLIILLVLGFAIGLATLAGGDYAMFTTFFCAISAYWTWKYRSSCKFYYQVKEAYNL